MRRIWTLLCGVIVPALLMTMVVGAGTATAVGVAQDGVVTDEPSDRSPYVLDNKVLDLAQVGNRIVVAGSFTRIRNAPTNGSAAYDQAYLFAFDADTGVIDRAFSPVLDGVVNVVEPGPNGTVYVGGSFRSVNGVTSGNRNLTQLSLATGQRTAFRSPAPNGAVNDLAFSGGRLIVGGAFDLMGTASHGGLATLNPATGAVDEYMGVDVAVNHNYPDRGSARASVGVSKLDVSPDGSRMIAIGNFRLADGLARDQAVVVLLQPGGAVVDPDWRTTRFEPACFSWAFDTYMRDVQFAPDGTYFAISTTGGANDGTLCDSVTRWDVADSGQDVQPRWASFAGGDTLFSVEVTGAAIYTGGHQRWMNNAYGHDSPGAGAVPRPGIAALDPRTGVPLAWNPGRHPRGVGAEALLATADGLYVGMDTTYIGNFEYWRPRLALFPLADGTALPAEETGVLPANVFLAGRQTPSGGGGTTGEVLYRVNAGGPALASFDAGPAWSSDSGGTNPLRNSGSNAAGYSPVPVVDGTVPPSTPSQVFDTERWDPSGGTEMQWNFPVAAGTTVDVRLYLANRCTCTQNPGQRAFDVVVEGTVVLDDYDIAGDVGHDVGTMKSFPVTSDGTISISFGHVVENPLVNAIEIVESTGAPTPGPVGVDDVVSRWFDGTTPSADTEAAGGGLEWSKARGAFLVDGALYYGYPDANGVYGLYRRTFDGTAFGEPQLLDPYNDPEWSDVTTGSGQTYRGVRPTFFAQLGSVSGMFFADGRIYYSRTGSQPLYSRGFSLDSGIVGATETTVASTGFSDVAGMFLSGDTLYRATRSTGDLVAQPWAGSTVTGSPVAVSGPSTGGPSWATRALFLGPGGPPPGPNQVPTAAFDYTCTGLACSFDGGNSADPDGTIASWEWDFDGTAGSGETADHTFADAGDHPVTLTVTDDDGATAQSTQTVTVDSPPPAAGIDLRGSAGTSARGVTSVGVDVPASVEAGDGLVLVLSTNSTVTGTAPSGWTQAAEQVAGNAPTTQVFQRVAGAGDAGSTVTVALSGQAKATLQLVAYSGTDAAGPIASVATAADGSGTSHTTPAATAAENGSWVLSVWSDKQADARTWAAPAGVTERSNLAGVGSGDVATLVADAGPVPAGPVAGSTATVATPSNRATLFTIVLAPGDGGPPPPPPPNEAPTAAFEYSCAALDCSFDASTSEDDGSVVGWSWNFGDGSTSTTGPAVDHSFATPGDKEVTLVVTDDEGATGEVVVTVPVSDTPPATGIGLRGSAGTAARAVTSASVDVPASVEAGDGLVLVLSTNSTVTGAAPAGWTQRGVVASGPAPTTQVFERVAGTGDAGTTLTVVLSGQAKVTLQLLAYSGTAASGPIASVTTAADGSGTAHTTPTATAPAGAWVLSVWSDKQADAREWTAPTSTSERSNVAGIGSGDIATLVTDSGGPVAAGTVGGLTATVPTASNRATMLTVVLAAG